MPPAFLSDILLNNPRNQPHCYVSVCINSRNHEADFIFLAGHPVIVAAMGDCVDADMGAGTILSMTIIAWTFLPVNRNPVPVCVICAPIPCQSVISPLEKIYPAFQGSLLRCIPTGWN